MDERTAERRYEDARTRVAAAKAGVAEALAALAKTAEAAAEEARQALTEKSDEDRVARARALQDAESEYVSALEAEKKALEECLGAVRDVQEGHIQTVQEGE